MALQMKAENPAINTNQGENMPQKDSVPDVSGKASEAAGQIKSSLDDAKTSVKEKASEQGKKAADSIDSSRGSAASSLDNAATSLHDYAGELPGGEKVATLAHETADKLGATAEYVRSHDTKAMMDDVEAFVKSHPGQSLLAAAVVGFLLGRTFSSND